MRAPTVVPSIGDLIAGATERSPLVQDDGKSGSTIERVLIDGERFVLKEMHPDRDWIARCLGDLCCWPVRLWTTRLLDAVPPSIDHTVVAVATDLGRGGFGGALLMRDVSPWLVPEGDTTVPFHMHRAFLDHMAEIHARFWGFEDDYGLLSLDTRYRFFCPGMIEVEAALGWPQPVPKIAAEGWERFERLGHPGAVAIAELVRDPSPLVTALRATPKTFLHGDWKVGNLGQHPDGRTILLDWAYPGEGPAAADLVWYLALNAARLPESKESTIAAYRGSLERHGVVTEGWWARQLSLALLGGLVWFGWEKALGGADELTWWLDRAGDGLALLL